MKSRIIIFIYLFIFINSAFSQITFQKTNGGAQDDGFYSVQPTSDGGYIMVGFTMSFGGGYYDVYLVKTDVNGDTVWTKTFGGSGDDKGYCVQQTSDSGYIITGSTNSVGPGFDLTFLIKTDRNGDTLWTQYYRAVGQFGQSGAKGLFVMQTMDGGYIIDCSAYVNGDELLLIKTDASGDTLWTKSYGMHILSSGSLQQTTDSGYIITGSRWGNNLDIYLLKTDGYGNLIWKSTYGGLNNYYGYSVKQTSDGGYIVVGGQDNIGAGVYLIKTDALGDTLWTRAYGGDSSDTGVDVRITSDSGYIIAGVTNSFGAGNRDGYLIKTDSMGDTLWTKAFGGITDDVVNSVQQTSDGGYILAGGSFLGIGGYDGYLIKTDANGNTGCYETSTPSVIRTPTTIITVPNDTDSHAISFIFANSYSIPVSSGAINSTLCISVNINTIAEENGIKIYPNPAQDYFTINTNTEAKNARLEIRNLLGENIYSTYYNEKEVVINCRGFLSGIYLVTIRIERNLFTKKLIIYK